PPSRSTLFPYTTLFRSTSLKQIASLFEGEKSRHHEATRTRLFAFALGSDANDALLKELAKKTHGYFAHARETEDISAMLKIFFRDRKSTRLNSSHVEIS